MQPIYDPEAVRPMEQELEGVGSRPLSPRQVVDRLLAYKQGSTVVVINSVCGCAAGGARPGVTLALQHSVIPDRLGTVFAGMDREAVQALRDHMPELPPSSPFMALFKDGQLVFALQRHHIEMMDPQQIAGELRAAFDQFCTGRGPSVSPEIYEQNVQARQCGSTVPLFRPV